MDTEPGRPKPLKGILKKDLWDADAHRDPERLVHSAECPLRSQSSPVPLTGLVKHSLGTSCSLPLRGILKNSSSSEEAGNGTPNHRKRQRWDEWSILATRAYLPSNDIQKLDHEEQRSPSITSAVMLEGAGGSTSGIQHTCICQTKRKKSQSWDECSILATQPPSLMRVDSADCAGTSSAETDGAIEGTWEGSANPAAPQTGGAAEGESREEGSGAPGACFGTPSFEELRRAFSDEGRHVKLARDLLQEEEEDEMEEPKERSTVPTLYYCTNCNCTAHSWELPRGSLDKPTGAKTDLFSSDED
ncbi:uncharacterized protein [Lepisosteus oculatus]|uniref:uncharacterized protein isoform X2 n=1 Tax=Lepisosteus oculatus TaxID=7918 RepID=UPI0037199B58